MAFLRTFTIASLLLIVVPGQNCLAVASKKRVKESHGRSYAYVIGVGSPAMKILQYRIGLDGRLSSLTQASVSTDQHTEAMAIDPLNRYLYLGLQSKIITYRIAENGNLTSVAAAVYQGKGVEDIRVSPDGKYVYVLNGIEDSVSEYTVNKKSGTLALLDTTHTGPFPISLAVSPNDHHAYVLCLNRGEPLGYQAFVQLYAVRRYGKLRPEYGPAQTTGLVINSVGNGGNIAFVPNSDIICIATRYGTAYYRAKSDGSLVALQYDKYDEDEVATMALPNSQGTYVLTLGGNQLSVAKLNRQDTLKPLPRIYFRNDHLWTTRAFTPGACGVNISSFGFDPTGRFVYFLDDLGGHIIQTRLQNDGKLVPLIPASLKFPVDEEFNMIETVRISYE